MSRLDEIRERWEAATPGPWEIDRYPKGGARIATNFGNGSRKLIADTYQEGDREAIFNARTDVPALLAAIENVLERCSHMDRSKPVGDWYYNEIVGALERALGELP